MVSPDAGAPPPSRAPLAFAALLGGGAAIAFSPIFVRIADVGPLASAFWRVALALPVLAAWAVWDERRVRGGAGAAAGGLHAALVAGLLFAGDLAFWHLSILRTSVANATLLANFAPIFVTLGAWLIYGLRVTRAFLIAMAVSIAGAVLLVGASFSANPQRLAGDALGIVTAVFYGGYILALKAARDAGGTARTMAVNSAVTAAALLPLALAMEPALLPPAATGWLVLLGLALIPQVIGQSLIAYAVAHLPASLSSLSLLVQPVLAAIYAWLMLGEAMDAVQIAGALVVLAGIRAAQRSERASRQGGSDLLKPLAHSRDASMRRS